MLARLFLVEEGIAATLARDRLRFTLAVRVSWDFSEYCENLRNFVDNPKFCDQALVDTYLRSWRSRYNELRPRGFLCTWTVEGELVTWVDTRGLGEDRDTGDHFEAAMSLLAGNPVHVYTLLWRLVTLLPGLKTAVGARIEVESFTTL